MTPPSNRETTVARCLRTPLVALLATLILVASSACSPGGDDNRIAGTITVSAAASLREALTQIGIDFRTAHPDVSEVKFNFDASSSLATQIRQGAPADVFASADEANMKKLTDAGLIDGSPGIFATNTMVIAVKPGNPQAIEGIMDLASGITVSLCGTDVPCGKYADQILDDAGVTIPPESITRGQNVKATLRAVSEGDADAAIVYLTDVAGQDVRVDPVSIPENINVLATYPIGIVGASNNKATARAFVDFVMSEAGKKVLGDAGFQVPK